MNALADVEVVIVGTGFSGIAMAMALKEAGRSFVMLEKGNEFGGTWRDNRYPGVACDVPSHLYSLKREPNPYWSHTYSTGDEIQDYILSIVEKHGLREHATLGAWVTAATFDEPTGLWRVNYLLTDGRAQSVVAESLVLGIGGLHMPHIPHIEGLHTFAGELIHTSAWPKDASMHGRRVGVIGTGASAVQVIPPLAEDAEHLTVFQRTPSWVLPRHNEEYSDRTVDRFRRMPRLMDLHRKRIRLTNDARAIAFDSHPELLKIGERQALAHLHNQVKDPALREALTPKYTLGCKRAVLSDFYYPAMVRDDVSLVTDGIEAVTPDGVVTADGTLHELDALILATGFDPAGSFTQLQLTGSDARTFADFGRKGLQTYLGISVPSFPNMFMLMGPNTGLGHTSVLLMIEAQVDHIMGLLAERERREASTVEIRPELAEAFMRQMDERSEHTVWKRGGCNSWYLDRAGRNRSIWPGSVSEYEKRCRSGSYVDYLFI